ncbi:hypothetical protein MCOR17_008027 [Pyricularia oryzae]|nr:hypothetical protein MCOR17_008027 [Pyricularia oryzae]KAI6483808.1 hypothetical protein MCOR13_010135 [Pyricularia oryzae]
MTESPQRAVRRFPYLPRGQNFCNIATKSKQYQKKTYLYKDDSQVGALPTHNHKCKTSHQKALVLQPPGKPPFCSHQQLPRSIPSLPPKKSSRMPVTTRSASRRMAAAQTAAAKPSQPRIKYRRVNGKPGLLISPPEWVTPTRRVVLTTGARGQRLTRIRGPGDRLLVRVPDKEAATKTSNRRLSTFVRAGRTWIRIRPAVQEAGGVATGSQKQGQ